MESTSDGRGKGGADSKNFESNALKSSNPKLNLNPDQNLLKL